MSTSVLATLPVATLETIRGGHSSSNGVERLKRSTHAQVAQYVQCARGVLARRDAGLPEPANAIESCRDFLAPLPGNSIGGGAAPR